MGQNISSIFGFISLGIMLLCYGAAVYAFVLFVKAAKQVIRVSDVYLAEKADQKQS